MKRLLLLLAVSVGTRLCVSAEPRQNVFTDGGFSIGCNYWASNAGMYMWRDWNPKAVEKDIEELSKFGINIMRVFPLWPDFQPLTALYGGGGSFRGFYQKDKPLANPAAVDEEMMARFRFMCDCAEKHHVKFIVGLITGWMSGRLFVPPALEGKNVLSDPAAIQWEVRFVRHFVREMKGHPAIAAWDLGNECNCMAPLESSAAAWAWMNQIASAIRMEDTSRPVVSGMHSISTKYNATWNLRDNGELMDVLTTHPYPLFTPECCKEPFNTMRNELHPSAESLLYAGVSGKPCFVEEAGDLGRCTASPERSAGNIRPAMFSAWANGLGAYLWWCGFDQQQLDFPPYIWNAVERELGLFTIDYQPKPALRAMKEFKDFLASFPYAKLPPRRVDAVCVVSEMESAWTAAFGAFLLSRQAGFDIRFAGAEGEIPDAKLYILPSGSGCDPYTYPAFNRVLAKVNGGATVLLSKGAGTRYSGFLDVTGNQIDSFYNQGGEIAVTLAGSPNQVLKAWRTSTTVLKPVQSKVLAADCQGQPMVTVCPYGKGQVIAVNWELEQSAIARNDCFTGKTPNPLYLIYREAAKIAAIERRIEKEVPGVGITEHPSADGKTVVVAVNYNPEPVSCPVKINGKIQQVYRGTIKDNVLAIGANDAAVFVIE